MKKLILLLAIFSIFYACEDVIDVDLKEAPPRLVIEATLSIARDSAYHNSAVKLSTTAPFFDETIPVVDDASVQIEGNDGSYYLFEHLAEGIYHSPLRPREDVEYRLTINYKNEVYTATARFQHTADLEFVEQRNDGGFYGDQIELKAFFHDPEERQNFYFAINSSERGVSRNVYEDKFFNDNYIFTLYYAEDLQAGDVVQFQLYGISEEYYNYMFTLLQQTSGNGGPFETQPAQARGNIVNKTNPENYPLGYFRISEVSTISYTVE